MVKAGKVPQELIDALPPAAAYEKAYFPTLEEVDANKAAVTGGWDSVVGANVQ
jgi:putative spermidine/putrescine transport system substrate-binding protein